MNEILSEEEYRERMEGLYANGDYQACLELFKEFHKQYPESPRMNFRCCWALYKNNIKPYDHHQGNLQQFIQQVNFIIRNMENKGDMIIWLTVKKLLNVVDECSKTGHMKPDEAMRLKDHYLDLVDYQSLSGEERSLPNMPRPLASHREEWFSRKTKLLQAEGRWADLSDYCDQALILLSSYHNNNDSWFAYRKAMAKFHLQDYQEGISLVENILSSGFKHWCLNKLLFENYLACQNYEQAIRQLCLAALSDRDHEKRVGLYDSFVQFLMQRGEDQLAQLHRHFVNLLREEKGWGLKQYQDGLVLSPEVAGLNKTEVLRQLQDFWRGNVNLGQEVMTGTIEKMLVENKSGFVKPDNGGKSCYFSSRDFITRVKHLEVGQRISFIVEERLDKKQMVMKPNAVQISLL